MQKRTPLQLPWAPPAPMLLMMAAAPAALLALTACPNDPLFGRRDSDGDGFVDDEDPNPDVPNPDDDGDGKPDPIDPDPPLPDGDPETPLTADIDVDADRNGVIDAADDDGEDAFTGAKGGVFFANVDDDDGDGNRDSRDSEVSIADDIDDMTPVRVRGVVGFNSGVHALTLQAEPPESLERVRVWRRDGDGAGVDGLSPVLEPDEATGEAELSGGADDIELLVEALVPRTVEWNGTLRLTLGLQERASGDVLSSDVIEMRVSPVIFPDNLQRPRTLFVMDLPSGGDNNVAFVSAMSSALPEGTELYTLDDDAYGYDRWVQDNMELGYQMKPGIGASAARTEMVTAMQLERGYGGIGLEYFVPYEFLSRSQGFLYPGGDATSHNYGGNLEVAPPIDGFPFGRMLYGGGDGGTLTGRSSNDTMNTDQVGFLDAQEIQGPALELSSEWLAVGHIDEIFQFVPDLTPGDKPFKVVVASPALARDALLAVQSRGGGQLVVFSGRDAEYSVDDIIAAPEFNALNEAAQQRIDSVVDEMKSELGLVDDDFLPVPVFYEEVGGGLVAAFNPGVQNLVTMGDRLFAPDPEGPIEDGVDAWQEATLASLADTGLDVIFVDVFNSYHRLLGEAHCGTNVDREPYATAWWTE